MLNTKQILKAMIPTPILIAAKEQVNNVGYHIWKYRLKEDPILDEPIFMIGCPRSGTSISVRLFATHHWVANWSEAGQIWDPTGYYDPDAEHCWGSEMVTKEAAKRLHSKFEWYRQTHNKRRFVNKHPRNSVRIEYIREVFPDALFVHVIRDGRAVVNSILKRIQQEPRRQKIPFGGFCKPPNWRQHLRDDPVEQVALQWREIVRYILGKKEELGTRYCEFKYEDLCLMPRDVISSAFEFAGLPASDEFLSRIPISLENMNYKYEEEFSPAQIDTINTIQKDLLRVLGYVL
ncbi:MAG: sulfotransferase [Candidatus Hodarchaeota archaeon]